MTIKTFVDEAGDKLKVQNTGTSGYGSLAVQVGTSPTSVFELGKSTRLPIAKEILAPTDHTIVEGPLPDVSVSDYMGVKRLTAGNLIVEVSEAEKDYCLTQARKYLALAGAIDRVTAKEEEERQERLKKLEKVKARREELARQFTGDFWGTYAKAYPSTKTAIDRIIELEEAAK